MIDWLLGEIHISRIIIIILILLVFASIVCLFFMLFLTSTLGIELDANKALKNFKQYFLYKNKKIVVYKNKKMIAELPYNHKNLKMALKNLKEEKLCSVIVEKMEAK